MRWTNYSGCSDVVELNEEESRVTVDIKIYILNVWKCQLLEGCQQLTYFTNSTADFESGINVSVLKIIPITLYNNVLEKIKKFLFARSIWKLRYVCEKRWGRQTTPMEIAVEPEPHHSQTNREYTRQSVRTHRRRCAYLAFEQVNETVAYTGR